MWLYIVAPFLSILPQGWRKAMPLTIPWRSATVISGLAESVASLAGMSYWYSHAMTTWVERGVSSALSGKLGPGVTPQEIGSVALAVWATHPLTWLLGYLGLEGTARAFGAMFTESTPGILPLFLLDKAIALFRAPAAPGISSTPDLGSRPSSIAGAVRERISIAKLPMVPDEICYVKNNSDDLLEIHSCRRKDDWVPPRTVRYEDAYYQLETDALGKAPRPFCYVLRRLPIGVPGRTVLVYSPKDALVKQS